jgi:serine/threonine protein kinase
LTEIFENNPQGLSDIKTNNIFVQMVYGLHQLHLNSIIHCKLHPNNTLIESNDTPIITDYEIKFFKF